MERMVASWGFGPAEHLHPEAGDFSVAFAGFGGHRAAHCKGMVLLAQRGLVVAWGIVVAGQCAESMQGSLKA